MGRDSKPDDSMISPYRIPAFKPSKPEKKRHWKCVLFGHRMQLISFLPIIFISKFLEHHPAIGLNLKCVRCGAAFNDTDDAYMPKAADRDYFVISPGVLIKAWRFPNGLPKRNVMEW